MVAGLAENEECPQSGPLCTPHLGDSWLPDNLQEEREREREGGGGEITDVQNTSGRKQ